MARGPRTKAKVAALTRSPSQLLHRAQQLALDIYAQEFGAGAITQRQYALLAAVAAAEGANQSDLVRATGIDRSTLADMAARMIGRGLLARERSTADARANTVRLTEAGRAALEDATPKMARADARLMKLAGDGAQRQALLSTLKSLVEAGEGLEAPAPTAAARRTRAAKPAARSLSSAKPMRKAR